LEAEIVEVEALKKGPSVTGEALVLLVIVEVEDNMNLVEL
jgi:hypothetical protein